MKKVLITGGSGMVGTHLTRVLIQQGYDVCWLGRKEGKKGGVITYKWDYESGYIDLAAFDGVEYIVNLAGALVAKRWTPKYKKELHDSRVLTTRLLFDTIKKHNFPVKKIISASAVGYYGANRELVTEKTPAGTDFLAGLCLDWEKEVNKFGALNIPHVILRFGVVFSDSGGFVEEVSKPIKMGFGAVLGSGKQLISWIHIDDLLGILMKAITEDNFEGVYNAVAPHAVTNKEVTKVMAKVLKKPLWLPHAPAFVLKLVFGEMSHELLVSHNVSAQKIMNAGYEFKHPNLEETLRTVLLKDNK